MAKRILLAGTIGGFLSIIFRSLAAHPFKESLTPENLSTFKIAVEYQLLHSLVLILIAILVMQKPNVKLFPYAGWAIMTGILFFSGSLYINALTEIKAFWLFTPAGGVSFLIGW